MRRHIRSPIWVTRCSSAASSSASPSPPCSASRALDQVDCAGDYANRIAALRGGRLVPDVQAENVDDAFARVYGTT